MAERRQASEAERRDRAFVAMSYVLGRRGATLLDGLAEPSATAVVLAERLGHAERDQRARALAPELGALGAALDARRLG